MIDNCIRVRINITTHAAATQHHADDARRATCISCNHAHGGRAVAPHAPLEAVLRRAVAFRQRVHTRQRVLRNYSKGGYRDTWLATPQAYGAGAVSLTAAAGNALMFSHVAVGQLDASGTGA